MTNWGTQYGLSRTAYETKMDATYGQCDDVGLRDFMRFDNLEVGEVVTVDGRKCNVVAKVHDEVTLEYYD
jgi:hypothetical protein